MSLGEEYSITLREPTQFELIFQKHISQLRYQGGKYSLLNWKSQDDSNGLLKTKEIIYGDSFCIWSAKTLCEIEQVIESFVGGTVEESMAVEETKSVLQWIKFHKLLQPDLLVVFETYFPY